MAVKKLDYLRELVQILRASGVRSFSQGDLKLDFDPPAPPTIVSPQLSAEMQQILKESLADPLSDPATHHGGLPSFRRYDAENGDMS